MTKAEQKLIKSLTEKKYRNELGLFLVEGEKNIVELLNSNFSIDSLYVTEYFSNKYSGLIQEKNIWPMIASQEELEKSGNLESNDSGIAVVKQKIEASLDIGNEIILALDTIQDPGNLGTIIRIADWYGIKKIVASKDTADFYNSKVIGASMGSFTRVEVFYIDLKDFLSDQKSPVYGAYLNGKNIHETNFPSSGILLMGNESKGINKELEQFVTDKITIPKFGGAESLNVGVATAVLLDAWKNSV